MSLIPLSFGSKRSTNGSLLKYSVYIQTKFLTDEIFNHITKLDNYKKLNNEPYLDFIDVYLKKNIFENIYKIVSKLKIIEHNSSFKREYIDISNLNLDIIKNQIVNKIDYFKKLNSKRNIKFVNKNNSVHSFLEKNKYKIKTNFLYEIIINIYEFIKIIIFQGNINFQKSSKNIMVKYGEGLDRKKRSDIFWCNNKLNKDNIIIFFNSDFTNISKFKTVSKTFKKQFHIHLKHNYILTNKLKNINLKQKFYNKNNKDLELWLLNQLTDFYIRLENYILFFEKTNTKILYDPYEYGDDGAIMAAAAKSLDICTIGKMRSYHSEIDGKLFFSHLNDIHILWGKHSLDRYLKKVKSKNYHLPQLFFLNGYSHTSNLKQNEHQNILQSIKYKFKKNSINKIILLLDTSIENSNSDSSFQILSKKFAIKFFTFFFNLLSENKNLGIIVKSKNNYVFESIFKNNKLFNNLKLNNKLIIVNDSKGVPSSDYSEIANLVVGINADDLPSSVLECLTNCSRAVIYDYSNLSNFEKKLYQSGYNKFIFNDFEHFQINLINYLDKKNDNFGLWGKITNEIHSFSDNLGYSRVDDLMNVLFNLLNENSKLESITKLNKYLINKYGDEKIYYTK